MFFLQKNITSITTEVAHNLTHERHNFVQKKKPSREPQHCRSFCVARVRQSLVHFSSRPSATCRRHLYGPGVLENHMRGSSNASSCYNCTSWADCCLKPALGDQLQEPVGQSRLLRFPPTTSQIMSALHDIHIVIVQTKSSLMRSVQSLWIWECFITRH